MLLANLSRNKFLLNALGLMIFVEAAVPAYAIAEDKSQGRGAQTQQRPTPTQKYQRNRVKAPKVTKRATAPKAKQPAKQSINQTLDEQIPKLMDEESAKRPIKIKQVLQEQQMKKTFDDMIKATTKEQYEAQNIEKQKRSVINLFAHPSKFKENVGPVTAKYVNLAAAMAASEGLKAWESGDKRVMTEWFRGLFTKEFLITIEVFDEAMAGFARMAYKISNGSPYTMQAIQPYMMPFGDFVSNYAMEVYNNPVMQQIRHTYDSHIACKDPDHPDAPPSNDPEVRLRCRQALRGQLVASVWETGTNPQSVFNHFFRAVQFGLVAKGQGYALQPYRSFVNAEGKLRWERVRMVETEAAQMGKAAAGTMEEDVMLIREINVARYANYLKETRFVKMLAKIPKGIPFVGKLADYAGTAEGLGTVVKGAGGLGATIGMFVAMDIITAVVYPSNSRTFVVSSVKDAQEKVKEAFSWYLDPTRTENIPWSLHAKDTAQTNWLTFFFHHNGDLNSQFFKDNKGGWHAKPVFIELHRSPDPDLLKNRLELINHHVFLQAGNFMKTFSDKFLGDSFNQKAYSKCSESKWFPSITQMTKCYIDWYQEAAPDFVKKLHAFDPEKYVNVRINDLNEKFKLYRNNIILAPVFAKLNLWSSDVIEHTTNDDRKEHYFHWIARGMKLTDPEYVGNKDSWHPAMNDEDAYINEVAKMVVLFDTEVFQLGNSYRNIWGCMKSALDPMTAPLYIIGIWKGCPADRTLFEKVMVQHSENEKRVMDARGPGTGRNELVTFLYKTYPAAFAPEVKSEDAKEREAVLDRVIPNLLTLEGAVAKQVSETNITAHHKFVRWLVNGMPNAEALVKEENKTETVSAADVEKFMALKISEIIVDPFFGGKSYGKACANALQSEKDEKEWDNLVVNIKKILLNETGVDYTVRQRLAVIMRTWTEIYRQQDQWEKELIALNQKYKEKLGDIIYERSFFKSAMTDLPTGTVRSNTSLLDPTLFTKGGLDLEQWSVFQRTFSFNMFKWANNIGWQLIEPDVSLPSGTINLMNLQISIYVNSLLVLLSQIDKKDLNIVVTPHTFNDLNIGSHLLSNTLADVFERYRPSAPNDGGLYLQDANPLSSKNIELAREGAFFDGRLLSLLYRVQVDDDKIKKNILETFTSLKDQSPDGIFNKADYDNLGNEPNPVLIQNMANQKIKFLNEARASTLRIANALQKRGTQKVKEGDEDELLTLLRNENFALPVLGALLGTQGKHAKLALILATQIINAQNTKTKEAHMSCYLLGQDCK